MDWVQFAIFFVGIFGLFIWNRTESRNDIRHMDNKLDSNRNMISEIHKETRDLMHAIHLEMKEFHNRLCMIEKERRK